MIHAWQRSHVEERCKATSSKPYVFFWSARQIRLASLLLESFEACFLGASTYMFFFRGPKLKASQSLLCPRSYSYGTYRAGKASFFSTGTASSDGQSLVWTGKSKRSFRAQASKPGLNSCCACGQGLIFFFRFCPRRDAGQGLTREA